MKDIKLKSFINKSGTHAISVCGVNEHGSGPFKTISIKIKSVPLTVDLEEVTLVNTNGSIISEVLSCGSTITVKVIIPKKVSVAKLKKGKDRSATFKMVNIIIEPIIIDKYKIIISSFD